MDVFADLLMGFQIALSPYNLLVATVGIVLGTIIGAAFAIVLVTFFAPLIAEFSLRFGPPECLGVQLLTFSAFVGLGGSSPVKTVAAILIGFMLATVGLDIISGQLRLTFGSVELMRGFSFVVVVIGLFGIGEILLTIQEGMEFRGGKPQVGWRLVVETLRELPQYWKTFVRAACIGAWTGIKPGGATAASFMSYGIARKFSKAPEKFGTGELEGVVVPETANNAAGVSALLPMITLGIPGSPTAAVMLGGLLIWGLQPGPMLFTERPDFVWGLIASMYPGNVIGVLIVLLFVPLFAAILRLPFAILVPLIIYVCAIGAYAVNNSTTDIWYMLIFGVIGYVFRKLDYPLAPLVLALVLGAMAESALRQSLIMSQGSPLIFFSSSIATVLVVLSLWLLLSPIVHPVIRKAWRRRPRSTPPRPMTYGRR